jgi:hypothetical protein
MTKGIIYYAIGDKYFNQAKRSAKSLKEYNDLPITVYTNKERQADLFDDIEIVEHSSHHFYDRINYFMNTPYTKTLHLDADTMVLDDIRPMFKMLERFDIIARKDPYRNSLDYAEKSISLNVPDPFPEYQCGVIGFNKTEAVDAFFEDWKKRYSKHLDIKNDQPFFRESLYHSDIRIGTLPPEYNFLVGYLDYLQKDAKIIHLTSPPTNQTISKIVDTINSASTERRVVYHNKWGKIVCLAQPKTAIVIRALRSLFSDGILKTTKKVFQKIK